jgi:hypothetical protein
LSGGSLQPIIASLFVTGRQWRFDFPLRGGKRRLGRKTLPTWISIQGAAVLMFFTPLSDRHRAGITAAVVSCAVLMLLAVPFGSLRASETQDYPTVAIADYVFGCMASNGQTREALEKCSCSIDVIASILSYDDYVEAETFSSMRLLSGEKGSLFRAGAKAREAVATLKRAQAEAEIRCF